MVVIGLFAVVEKIRACAAVALEKVDVISRKVKQLRS
jgi:hypothetical protein